MVKATRTQWHRTLAQKLLRARGAGAYGRLIASLLDKMNERAAEMLYRMFQSEEEDSRSQVRSEARRRGIFL